MQTTDSRTAATADRTAAITALFNEKFPEPTAAEADILKFILSATDSDIESLQAALTAELERRHNIK